MVSLPTPCVRDCSGILCERELGAGTGILVRGRDLGAGAGCGGRDVGAGCGSGLWDAGTGFGSGWRRAKI